MCGGELDKVPFLGQLTGTLSCLYWSETLPEVSEVVLQ